MTVSRVCPMVCVSARLSPLLCVFHLLRFVCSESQRRGRATPISSIRTVHISQFIGPKSARSELPGVQGVGQARHGGAEERADVCVLRGGRPEKLKSKKVVVCIHGGLQTMWCWLLKEKMRGVRLISVGRAGYGNTGSSEQLGWRAFKTGGFERLLLTRCSYIYSSPP